MALQQTIGRQMCGAFAGDIVLDGPQRAETVVLKTAAVENNVIGRVVTADATDDATGAVGGAGKVLGILTERNQYVLRGAAGDPLAPSMQLPNGYPVQVHSMVSGVAVLVKQKGASKNAVAIGDPVAYDTTTGEIVTAKADGTADTGSALIPNARFVRNNITGVTTGTPVLAIVELTL